MSGERRVRVIANVGAVEMGGEPFDYLNGPVRLTEVEAARFFRLVVVRDNGCWEWHGQMTPGGYPRFRRGPGKPEEMAHRVAWEHVNGTRIPEGMQLGHTCHDRAVEAGTCDGGVDCPHRRCVSPLHTEPQTPSENTMLSNHAKRRTTHCPKGHEYTADNTMTRNGRRFCRECDRARKRKGPGE